MIIRARKPASLSQPRPGLPASCPGWARGPQYRPAERSRPVEDAGVTKNRKASQTVSVRGWIESMASALLRATGSILLSVAVLLLLAGGTGAEARPPHRPLIPRKTGNLSITSYRKALMEGKRPKRLDPMLRDPEPLSEMGMTGVEDYPTFDVVEPGKGKTNFTPYIANARACRRLKMDYAIYPWVHFYPDWVEEEPGFVPYTNMEDGTTCRQPSGWAPYTTTLVERFYERLGGRLDKLVSAVYVADCSEYGELGYPTGYTKWLRKDDRAKVAWWCGDAYARVDFRIEQLRRWGTLEEISKRWGTLFRTADEIDYPPMELLKSNPDPRKLTPPQRRRILDFVYWYQNASARRMRDFIRIAQEAFPDKPCEVKLGHADESAMMGHSYSSACRILRNVPRLAIRSTHAAVSYFHVKRVATPARFYGFMDFLTEPPGTFKPERMAERIFTDACAGVTAYFDYPGNPQAAGGAYTDNIGLLDGKPAVVDVALFFPEADHYLRIDKPYPDGLLECANAVRDVADFDVIDERLIANGILQRYAVLVIVGDPLIEDTTWIELRNRVRRGHLAAIIQVVEAPLARPVGEFVGVDGVARPLLTGNMAKEVITRVVGQPDGDAAVAAVQQAYAAVLGERGLKDGKITMLTARDQVWTGLFDHRILAYNTTDRERTVNHTALAGRCILETRLAGRSR